MNGETGIVNGCGKKQYVNLKDPQHINVMVSVGTLITLIISAVTLTYKLTTFTNEQKNYREKVDRRWNMTWTIPEHGYWVRKDGEKTKQEHYDPMDVTDKFKEMKASN